MIRILPVLPLEPKEGWYKATLYFNKCRFNRNKNIILPYKLEGDLEYEYRETSFVTNQETNGFYYNKKLNGLKEIGFNWRTDIWDEQKPIECYVRFEKINGYLDIHETSIKQPIGENHG